MSKLIIEVCKVDKVEKHPNADLLDILTIKGWNCIVGVNQFKAGDLVVYCPPDSVIPNDLIEKYNLEYLKKCGRVGTIKLRKFISQGLVLDIPEGVNWKEGKDVANKLGITKYEPPLPSYQRFQEKDTILKMFGKYREGKISFRRFVFKCFGIIKDKFKRKRNINPFFSKYIHIENIKNYNKIFKEGETVVITEKLHGCLNANSQVLLYDGTSLKIKEIVENQLNVLLAGRDERGKIVPTRITNWFNNGNTKIWKKVKFARQGLLGNYFGSLICTPIHNFLKVKDDEYYEVNDLKRGDQIYLAQKIFNIPQTIKDVLIGKMLGDGSFDKSKNSISFSHKKEHEDYLLYTMNYLGFLAGNQQKDGESGYNTLMCRGRTKSNEAIGRIFRHWYCRGNSKKVPPLKLSPISLAFWYMDDGSLGHHSLQKDRASFATCGFDELSVDNLLDALKKLNIVGTKYLSEGKYWRIRLNTKEAYNMFDIIAPYIVPCLRYKLPMGYRMLPYLPIPKYQKKYKNVLTVQEVLSIENYDCSQDNSTEYDLETETHNYIANGVVVHNSNFRAGWVLRKKNKWMHRRKRQEFCYGSHNVQLTGRRGKQYWYGEDVYGAIAERYKLAEIIPEDYIIYGEIYGKGIQGLEYDLENTELAVFDVKHWGEYLAYGDLIKFCEERKLPMVPLLAIEEFDENTISTYTQGQSIIAKHMREGCVIKSIIETPHPMVGRKILKSINPEYLVTKDRTDFH